MDQDAIDQMMADRQGQAEPAAPAPSPQEQVPADAPADGGAVDQDAIDQMMADRQQPAADEPPEPAEQEPPPAEAPSAQAEESADASVDQDAIDQMMADRQAGASEPASDGEGQPEAQEASAAPAEAAVDQDAIDQMMAARQGQPQDDSPASESEPVDQDAIDQMLAAREAQPAKSEALDQDGVDEMLASREGGAEQAPEPAADLDQDAIDKMLAAREANAKAKQDDSVSADQDTIDAMLAARQGGQKAAEPSAESDQADQAAIDAMMASRAGAGKQESAGSAGPQPAGSSANNSSRWTWLHMALVANSVLILLGLATLLALRFMGTSGPSPVLAEEPPVAASPANPADANQAQPVSPLAQPLDQDLDLASQALTDAPTTWAEAEAAFAKGRYEAALGMYLQLLHRAQGSPANRPVADLLRLRAGQCSAKLGMDAQAKKLLKRAADSASPAVRAQTHLAMGIVQASQGQYLPSRTRAYQCLTALGQLDLPSGLEADCDLLIARSLTQKVLWFYNPDIPLLPEIGQTSDLFAGLSERDLKQLLQEGKQHNTQYVLGPKVEHRGGTNLLKATCNDATVEALLSRLSTEAALDVQWGLRVRGARHRTVSMHFSQITPERLAEIGCGAVGLIARDMTDGVVVEDPRAIDSSEKLREMLLRESVVAWRRYLLRHPQDPRVPDGHLALAKLYELMGEQVVAMREYEVIANRFQSHDAAQRALLESAKLRIALRDFTGARDDLLELLDRHPEFENTEQVYLNLARATMEAGLHAEAQTIFEKLYFLNLTPESQAAACYGVGTCAYRQDQHQQAIEWMDRYAGLAGEDPGSDLAGAMLTAGRSHAQLGEHNEAISVLYRALASDPAPAQRRDISLTMADVQLRKGNSVKVLGALDELDPDRLSPAQRARAVQLRAGALREMGLPERGIDTIDETLKIVADPQLQADLLLAKARCERSRNDRSAARKLYAQAISALAGGPEAQIASCELAEMCYEDKRYDHAAELARGIVSKAASPATRTRARRVLVAALIAKGDYEAANEVGRSVASARGAQP
jgi:tetratricopeptide (TPR) repeat protein